MSNIKINHKISVIVPVFNVETYLRKCLDSLVSQTLRDIEIICINDASPDSCASILEEYQNTYDNIVVFTHKKIKV